MELKLSTFDEASATLQQLLSGQITDEQAEQLSIKIEGELSEIRIHITGDSYHSSIPGDLAKGLWEFQSALYKAGAFALYQVADARKLTSEQREQLELVFNVAEGSSDLVAAFNETLKCLNGVLKGMTGKQRVLTILGLALIVCGFWGFATYSDNLKEVALAQEKTAQLAVVKDTATGVTSAILNNYQVANAIGTQAIVKGASDATSITAGQVALDRDAIQALNKKADRVQSSAEILDSSFRVFEMRSKDSSKDTCTVAAPDGREFNLVLDHDEFGPDLRRKLWDAAENRQSIKLELNITSGSDGTIRKVQLLTVH